MKKLLLFASALAIFVGCKKQFEPSQELTKTLTVNVLETKTAMTAVGGIAWSATDKIAIIETADDTNKKYNSAAAKISDGAASFTASIAAVEANSFTYNAVYPATALSNALPQAAVINLPTTQKPVLGSFDPAADILIAKEISQETQASSINAKFKRMVSLAQMNITGIKDGEKVRRIEITFPNPVVGQRTINLSTGEVVGVVEAKASNTITLDYTTKDFNANFTAFFNLFPTDLNAGDKIKVSLRTMSGDLYEKTITLTSDESLDFYNARISGFTVNMTGCRSVVEFPVVFPCGWEDTDNDGVVDKGWNTVDRPWLVDWINAPTYLKAKASATSYGHNGTLYSANQPQAHLKWVWDEKIAHTEPKHYIELAQGTGISSLGIKGIWTDDYFEFVLPVKNFAVNTTLKLTMHIYQRFAPVFWEVIFKDGGEWKSTAVDNLLGGYDINKEPVTARATWAIPGTKSDNTLERTHTVNMTFDNAIDDGEVLIRVKCVDGSCIADDTNTVKTLTKPYSTSAGLASAPVYFTNPANKADSNIVISIVE